MTSKLNLKAQFSRLRTKKTTRKSRNSTRRWKRLTSTTLRTYLTTVANRSNPTISSPDSKSTLKSGQWQSLIFRRIMSRLYNSLWRWSTRRKRPRLISASKKCAKLKEMPRLSQLAKSRFIKNQRSTSSVRFTESEIWWKKMVNYPITTSMKAIFSSLLRLSRATSSISRWLFSRP